ncbi:hypothetical protein DAEQUDRAFT_807557, partial [Daedalea quercina L-15889]
MPPSPPPEPGPSPPPAPPSSSSPPPPSPSRPPLRSRSQPLPPTTTTAASAISSGSAPTYMPALPTPSSTPPADPMALTPARLRPLLRCPLCPPSTPLHSPLTLRCGHTLCTAHARPDTRGRCPLPTCIAAPPAPAVAPHPESGVGYFAVPAVPGAPAAAPAPAAASAHRPFEGRADVTVGKILELVDRAQAWFDDDRVHSAPAYPPDEQTDSEPDPDDDPEHDIEDMYFEPAPEPSVAGPSASASTSTSTSTSAPAGAASAAGHAPSPARDRRSARRPRSPSPDAPTRPRKRRRRCLHPTRARPPPPPPDANARARDPAARFAKELLGELTCDICSQLFVQPVTAPCQHTFCAGCLHRSLDYNMACPVCRDALEYAYFQEHPCNKLVLALILHAFPEAYAERRAAIDAEERDARLDTPIMVCQLSYPGMPTMLHFFEPRYRLMLRRCLATRRPRFGMIPPPRVAPSASHPPPAPAPHQQQQQQQAPPAPAPGAPTNHAPNAAGPTNTGNEYGTMLEIRSVQMLPDGRAVVETWGAWRFRIVERGTLDGYVVARVERVDDWEEAEAEGEVEAEAEAEADGQSERASRLGAGGRGGDGAGESGAGGGARAVVGRAPGKERTIEQLMGVCHEFLNELREGTPWVVHRLNQNYVAMPADPASFSFWMGALLPIDEHEKAKLLPIRSARLRLRLVVHWIEKLQSQWARSYGSASRLQVVLWWLRRQLMRAVVGQAGPAGATG